MISSFSCMLRPDYNFAFALLSYYALKRSNESKTLHLVGAPFTHSGHLSERGALRVRHCVGGDDGQRVERQARP